MQPSRACYTPWLNMCMLVNSHRCVINGILVAGVKYVIDACLKVWTICEINISEVNELYIITNNHYVMIFTEQKYSYN